MSDASAYFTKEKLLELTKEIEYLKTVRRKEVAEQLEYAKSLGDLSENAEYQEARGEQANIEDRISRIENILQSARVMETHQSDVAEIGSSVSLQRAGGEEVIGYTLVNSEEANISQGKLSIDSPLGQAALGKRAGETFSAKTPGGLVTYTVVGIK